MSQELQRRIEQLSHTVDQLVIVDRQISGDLCATFSLRGPPGSLIGLTCVSVLPCHHVAVVGDLCTAVFDTRGDRHWRAAIGRFYRRDLPGFSVDYVREKANIGMRGFPTEEYRPEVAVDDLEELFRRDGDGSDGGDPVYSLRDRADLTNLVDEGETELYARMSEIDCDFADGHLPGQVLRRDIIAGALVMNHLSRLLDAEGTECDVWSTEKLERVGGVVNQ
jgi:hypothetical protein